MPPRVRFGPFHFDSTTRELRRGEEELRLSPKAFRLLEILLERRPEAVSQQALYDELWPETFVESANLHNLVSQIRAAIGDDDHTVIRTIYGYGFSFAGEVTEAGSQQAQASAFALSIQAAHYPLREGENIVGREAEANIQIRFPSISRRHARLLVSGDEVIVEDLGSKNGTFVEGRRVERAMRASPGARIDFGDVQSRLRRCSEEDSTMTVPSPGS
ncbi:MAG TPA: FHA domain-containing protein [Thermoanaerobaculia bacterium]|nr:FHA domain-containing protein [Thermoanaerobaculia bacterium]